MKEDIKDTQKETRDIQKDSPTKRSQTNSFLF